MWSATAGFETKIMNNFILNFCWIFIADEFDGKRNWYVCSSKKYRQKDHGTKKAVMSKMKITK